MLFGVLQGVLRVTKLWKVSHWTTNWGHIVVYLLFGALIINFSALLNPIRPYSTSTEPRRPCLRLTLKASLRHVHAKNAQSFIGIAVLIH